MREPREGVDVGILGTDAERRYEGEVTVSDVATWAEYGLGQPQRSWLRSWIEEARTEIDATIKAETRAVLAGTRTHRQALARVGVWAVGQIQQRIANGIEPANAPSTIAKKGSSVPLIDKGQLRSSIKSQVR